MTAEIQTPSGDWVSYVPGGPDDDGRGNIRINGQVYAYAGGQTAYRQQAANQPDPNRNPTTTNPIPTNPNGTQVGGGTPFVGQAPTSAPPGYHWDATLAMFQPDAQQSQTVQSGAYTGAPTDRAAIKAWIGQLAALPGADPSLAADPDYWVGRIIDTGGLTASNADYWKNAGVGASAFFNNPNREQGGSASATSSAGAAPTFTPPAYTPPPAFSYADFVAPDPSQVASDPWTQYTLKTQQDALQKSAAARGTLTTGGTINDLLLNASDIANQGYQGIYNRAAQDYSTNRAGAVQTYNTNYGTQYSDPYHYQYQGAQDTYNAAAHNYDQGQMYDWNRTLFGDQQAQEAWANKFKLLGLI